MAVLSDAKRSVFIPRNPECENLRVRDTGVQSGHSGSRGTTTSRKDVSNCDVPLTRKIIKMSP